LHNLRAAGPGDSPTTAPD